MYLNSCEIAQNTQFTPAKTLQEWFNNLLPQRQPIATGVSNKISNSLDVSTNNGTLKLLRKGIPSDITKIPKHSGRKLPSFNSAESSSMPITSRTAEVSPVTPEVTKEATTTSRNSRLSSAIWGDRSGTLSSRDVTLRKSDVEAELRKSEPKRKAFGFKGNPAIKNQSPRFSSHPGIVLCKVSSHSNGPSLYITMVCTHAEDLPASECATRGDTELSNKKRISEEENSQKEYVPTTFVSDSSLFEKEQDDGRAQYANPSLFAIGTETMNSTTYNLPSEIQSNIQNKSVDISNATLSMLNNSTDSEGNLHLRLIEMRNNAKEKMLDSLKDYKEESDVEYIKNKSKKE